MSQASQLLSPYTNSGVPTAYIGEFAPCRDKKCMKSCYPVSSSCTPKAPYDCAWSKPNIPYVNFMSGSVFGYHNSVQGFSKSMLLSFGQYS